MGSWDGKVKRLVGEAPQDFVSWLVKGGIYVSDASPELQSRNIHADILLNVDIGAQEALLHIEFQRRSDRDMAWRLWEYNVLATCQLRVPVLSYIIYLKEDKGTVSSPFVAAEADQLVHQFHFGVIRLWDIPTESFFASDRKGLLPLAVLSRDGKNRDVVERIIDGLYLDGVEPMSELLSLTYGLAALTFDGEHDQGWLRRRFSMLEDILMDTWAYKELMQRGEEKGIEKGIEQEKKDVLHKWQEMLLSIVQAKFPDQVEFTQKYIRDVEGQEVFQQLIIQAGVAQHADEYHQQFLDIMASL
ncbi:MAG TPA: hypothetical protein VL461_03815 [Dictyobacter sp.]|jgi:hypothetical protein|nr:hypothetical protein [Dictyobacter sp.]